LEAVRHTYETPKMSKTEKRQRDSLNQTIADLAGREEAVDALVYFSRALVNDSQNRFNEALGDYDKAVSLQTSNPFLYINRGALQAEMIDFISSMEQNVQVLSLDNSRTARARVNESRSSYDYTPAIHDMKKAVSLMPEFPYSYYNLGNLYTLSSDLPEAILQYTKAIQLYPYLPEAYYNRGLVLIYLKDSEKGCLDMSKAGELGIDDAYSVISKYCIKKQ
ncbi:MAG: tetratricopeptide repeat protein, partial [Bacteroidales bacterium]|nr:tetratricopeptide repeat protein [Bacteroidales bacterium]